MDKNMDLDSGNNIFQMTNTKVSTKTIKGMDRENIDGEMETFIMVSLRISWEKVKEKWFGKVDKFMKVTGKMDSKMELDSYSW